MTCQTLKCGMRAAFRLVWDDSGEPELCCIHHAGHYAGQPNIMRRATIEPLNTDRSY